MATIEDKEFGQLTIRRSSRSSSMRATVAPNGTLRISVPSYAPIFMVKRMITTARPELRKLLDSRPKLALYDGMSIGKSHTLVVREGTDVSVKRSANQLIVTLHDMHELNHPSVVKDVRSHMRAIARREAKSHLPRRLSFLASKYGFTFSGLRFTHASSRWGSCNQKQAISLNIALMNLPYELIDYVLIHELAHTKHLNHSSEFWQEVEKADPDYKLHRKALKAHSPAI